MNAGSKIPVRRQIDEMTEGGGIILPYYCLQHYIANDSIIVAVK
jgi:hypothetical protein